MKLSLVLLLGAIEANKKNNRPKRPKIPKPSFDECRQAGLVGTVDKGTMTCRKDKCIVKCPRGYVLNGQKKIQCKRERTSLVIKPEEMPECRTCPPLRSLVNFENFQVHEKKRRKGSLYTMSCPNNSNILPYNRFFLAAQCHCDRSAGDCYWQGQGGINIQDQLEQMRCEVNDNETINDAQMTDLVSRPSKITPGLSCDNPLDRTIDRIVGGHDAEPHSWPWIVQLKYGHNVQNSRSGHSCSGTIVNENLIISAAHCCQAYRNMDLLLGIVAEHSVLTSNDRARYIRFRRVVNHPLYRYWTLEHDICLMVPQNPIDLSPNNGLITAARACLPGQNEPEPNRQTTKCWTAGWGRLAERGAGLASVLQEVDVKLISDDDCRRTSSNQIFHPQSQKCAGHLEGGKDACQGDSGGPLICEENGKPVLRGIVSAGIGCARQNHAGIYTRIEKYIDWVNLFINNDLRAIREHKNSLRSGNSGHQRSGTMTNREARQLQYKLLTEGKITSLN